jgi:hypothetical protein
VVRERLSGQVAVCRHCGENPAGPAPDAMTEAERELWDLLDAGERIRAQAPVPPDPAAISSARRAVAEAISAQRTVEAQVTAIGIALAKPSSWLRPRHRLGLVSALRRGRAALIAAIATREHVEYIYGELEQRSAAWRTHLNENAGALAAADEARRELARVIDDLIDAYAKSSDQPAWFRFGLGYPPRPDRYAEWLDKARAAIAHRRRTGKEHPLEP